MDLLRLATAGSVDDGKSTLIGRLLLDAKLILEDHLEALDAGARNGDGPDLASITDGLRAEREQGITIDVAYRFFQTEKRSFIIADTPGHERYTRNMVSGASTADLAPSCSTRAAVIDQSRRHASLSALLGIKHVVACVNKMDLVDWDEDRFREVEPEFRDARRAPRDPRRAVIPIAALKATTSWSAPTSRPGTTARAAGAPRAGRGARRPGTRRAAAAGAVGDRARGGSRRERSYTGQLAGGALAVGDAVMVQPAGSKTTIAAMDTLEAARGRGPAASVTVGLADDLDVSRGDVICSPGRRPAARELDATICWMGEAAERRPRYALKHTTRTVRATVQAVHSKLDMTTLEDKPAPRLELNDIGRVTLRTSAPVLADHYADNRVTGAFILIDEHTNDTVGAGMVEETREREPAEQARRDVTWHDSELERDSRWEALGHRGATVWLTGLPASGKSTIAAALERRLVEDGRPAYLLDGDNVRHGLSDDLGFEPGERSEHIRRVAHVARLLADAGVVAVVSLVSPMEADRKLARELHDAAGLTSTRCSSPPPWRSASAATRRACTRAPAPASCRASPASTRRTRSREHPDFEFDTASDDGDDAVARLLDALAV